MVELLIRAGADLHIRNGKALTAVGSATNNGHAETVLKLVSHGAAWRNLPDINVIKTICRKTNYKCATSASSCLESLAGALIARSGAQKCTICQHFVF